ncbi:MAG TPA: hypothetical protein VFB55_02245 [Verrucomicrobiae bacterium]|nr:hypothetical protein [Verrucomicrobiae bacterium]
MFNRVDMPMPKIKCFSRQHGNFRRSFFVFLAVLAAPGDGTTRVPTAEYHPGIRLAKCWRFIIRGMARRAIGADGGKYLQLTPATDRPFCGTFSPQRTMNPTALAAFSKKRLHAFGENVAKFF